VTAPSKLRRVLVPDATNRPALTAIRSLGRRGCRIVAGDPGRPGLGTLSRFCDVTFRHPDPALDPEGFARAVARVARDEGVGAIVPAADVTTNALHDHVGELPDDVVLVAPPRDALRHAHDKIRLMSTATEVGVPVPDGFATLGDPRSDPRFRAFGFPVVLKPSQSRYFRDGSWHMSSVRIVHDDDDLDRVLRERAEYHTLPYLVQRLVPGEGRGVFVLASGGELQSVFAHRRIREKPPWGGVSTLCETAEPEVDLVEYSRRLMRALDWTGVAMVEFKWDPESRRAWLMEINGRFWGSMQLAVSSGIDFPWWAYRLAVGATAPPPAVAPDRVRLWWIPGDIDHFLTRLARGGGGELRAVARDLARTRQGLRLDPDTLEWDDPLPFLWELGRKVSFGIDAALRPLVAAAGRLRPRAGRT